MVALTSKLTTPVGKNFGSLSLRILVEHFMSQLMFVAISPLRNFEKSV